MSVINKMLRDLDQRQVSDPLGSSAPRPPVAADLQRGTHSVPAKGRTGSAIGRGAWVLAALALTVAVGVTAWWVAPWNMAQTPVAAPPVPPAAVVVAVPTPAASAPVIAASEPLPVSAVLPVEAASTALSSESTPTEPAPVPAMSARAVTPHPNPNVSLRMEPMLPTRKALEAVLSSSAAHSGKAASSAPETTSPAQRQQQASTDALAQAQSLWNTGNHAQALDLMQQSVDAAERAVKAGNSAVGNPVLLSLVRESVRMQMVQSNFAAVWELLARLEPVLGSAPDLWALRGNTAQRLGRHQDSVNAYRMALQANPNEQRWLLGSAVSLAALGQTSQATEMAERARSVGEISREVQAYLRQLGVPLKDK